MSQPAARVIGYTAMILIFIICAVVIVRWAIDFISWSTLDAAWAQTIGSILAILVAVWIARRDFNARKEAEMTVALISAVAMSQSATVVQIDLVALIHAIEHTTAEEFNRDELEDVREQLFQLSTWEVIEVARLSPLPNHCALNLARAQSTLYDCRLFLDSTLGSDAVLADRELLRERIQLILRWMKEAVGLLRRAIETMNYASGAEWRNKALPTLRSAD